MAADGWLASLFVRWSFTKMLAWLQSLDTEIFRWVNLSLQNPFFDKLMPFASGNPFFVPAVIVILLALIWKGGIRGRVFAVVILLTVAFCDGAVCNEMKHAVGRLRPFQTIADVHTPPKVGLVGSGSMPSSHAGNCFAAATITWLFYRRSWRYMFPLAALVGFSRIYNGVHYPSDVLAGTVIGTGTALAIAWALESIWRWIGPKWFHAWHCRMPSVLNPDSAPKRETYPPLDQASWLRLGYVLIALLFLVRIGYLASGKIELSEDEAYQWLWSKHIDLSYYSKPPLIAYTQFLGTHIWGDTMFGVRFFSPVLATILSCLVLRFMAREFSAKAGVTLILMTAVTVLTAVGATLMTVDPLSVLFWTAGMIVGWRACQPDGTTRDWIWVGLWAGLGFLSKYTNLFQWLSWALFFVLWAPARKHLRRPGPYVALLINALCAIPVLVWNAQRDWVTAKHVANDGHLGEPFHFTLRFLGEFMGAEFGLLNPVFFIGMLCAIIGFWKSRSSQQELSAKNRYPLKLYLFCMGASVFGFYLLLSFHSRIYPNWIAPSVIPFFCLTVIYFGEKWDKIGRWVKALFGVGIAIGIFIVVLAHDTNLVGKMFKRPLPAKVDPLRRVRGWSAMAEVVGDARKKLEAEGKPAFVIGDHYGNTSVMNFYMPEAKRRAQTGDELLCYYLATSYPANQYYFWPGYEKRKGQNAIYVHELKDPPLRNGWLSLWLKGEQNLCASEAEGDPIPGFISRQFDSVTDLGVKPLIYRGRTLRYVQLLECRGLK